MIYYTKYAEQKFVVLRDHKFSLIKEDVKKVLTVPNQVGKFDDKLWLAEGGYSDEYNLRVIFEQDEEVQKVVTFYPVKR